MIAYEHEIILGPEVERIQGWLGMEGDGAVLIRCISHQVALHEAKAIESIGKKTIASMGGQIPVDAQRNLALAEQYRSALIVLEKFGKEQSEFIKTNLPINV